MNNQKTPVLAKSAPSGGNYAEPREKPNAVTLAAMQEAEDIISGKKKVKWNRFQPGETKAGAKEKLKKMLGS